MRLRHSALAVCAAVFFLAPPALAHERHGDEAQGWHDDAPGNWRENRDQRPLYDPAREAWLSDCRHRIDPHDRRMDGPDRCEQYLHDYYERAYAAPQAGYAYGPGYPTPAYTPGYAYAQGCCAAAVPMMMVPVQAKPECMETVEYIYEDVPIRRKAYHAPVRSKIVHDKRVKVVADKRVQTK